MFLPFDWWFGGPDYSHLQAGFGTQALCLAPLVYEIRYHMSFYVKSVRVSQMTPLVHLKACVHFVKCIQ